MTLGVIGISTAYVLLALLLLSVNLYSRLHWGIKAATIVLTSVFYVVTWLSFPPLMGWPSGEPPPERFRVLSAHVLQPNKQTGSEGGIYLWLHDIAGMSGDALPRSHALPYSESLHEAVIGVKAKLGKGITQLGEWKEPEKNMPEVDRKARTTQVSVEIEFYDMPDPLFPEK